MGTFTEACGTVGVPHSTAYDWRKIDPDFDDAVRRAMLVAHESGGDLAEYKLRKKINDEDTACLLFYLKTKHKARGYVERQEQTGADGGAIKSENINLTMEEIIKLAKERGLPTSIFEK